jgi:ankyrin repeat protein
MTMRRVFLLPLVLLAASVTTSSQTPPSTAALLEVIRANALPELRALVKSGGANDREDQGFPPLVLTTAFGSLDAVRVLLDAGADPNQAGAFGLTPLHVAARDPRKVRLLLERGASVHAVSTAGYTPLMVAAVTNGSEEVVRLLIARGADVNAADTTGVTALIGATYVDNAAAARLLLAAGANVSARGNSGAVSTALIGAAANGNASLTRALLAAKADVSATAANSAATVKNGPVLFGGVTALHAAPTGRNAEVLRLLIDAGAKVDALDVRGMTPLMIAIATDHPDLASIRLLAAHGADSSITSAVGETALDWARKFNDPAVMRVLRLAPAPVGALPLDTRAPTPQRKAAVERSLTLLQTSAARVMTDGGCVACHAQPITAMATAAADVQGFHGSGPTTATVQTATSLAAGLAGLLQPRLTGGAPDGQVYSGAMMALEKAPPSLTSDALVYYLLALQHEAGNWHGTSATRAPLQDGDMTRTALAVRILTAYRTPALNDEIDGRVKRAMSWLDGQSLVSNEDASMQLLGLTWGGANASTREKRARNLIASQRPDGGWGQTANLPSDAYATGQALYALSESRVAVAAPVVMKATSFLLRTQQPDGSWHVVNRAMKIQPYFESGFPYGHDQWISHAGTAWAVIALSRGAAASATSTR